MYVSCDLLSTSLLRAKTCTYYWGFPFSLFQQLENVVIVVQPFLSLQRATSFYVLNILEQSITCLSAYVSCNLLSTSLLRAKTCTYMYLDLKIFLCQTWSIMRNAKIIQYWCNIACNSDNSLSNTTEILKECLRRQRPRRPHAHNYSHRRMIHRPQYTLVQHEQ